MWKSTTVEAWDQDRELWPLYLRLGWGPPDSHHRLVAVPARTFALHSDLFEPHGWEVTAAPQSSVLRETHRAAPHEPQFLTEVLLSWIKNTRVKAAAAGAAGEAS